MHVLFRNVNCVAVLVHRWYTVLTSSKSVLLLLFFLLLLVLICFVLFVLFLLLALLFLVLLVLSQTACCWFGAGFHPDILQYNQTNSSHPCLYLLAPFFPRLCSPAGICGSVAKETILNSCTKTAGFLRQDALSRYLLVVHRSITSQNMDAWAQVSTGTRIRKKEKIQIDCT